MLGVFAGLCLVFSVLTYDEQPVTGDAAAEKLAEQIVGKFGTGARVLIAVRGLPEDEHFAKRLEGELKKAGLPQPTVATGEPKDARQALVKLAADGKKLDAVAATQPAGEWLVFGDLKQDFPTLGDPVVVVPKSEHWPNFLKLNNLLNIANQIAVIAIIAVGMTIVIVTGGIDLSVGSLVALAAIIAAKLIRDHAGGLQATPLGMTLACLGAIAACGAVGALTGAIIVGFRVPPFIVTLAMMLVGRGLANMMSAHQTIHEIPDSITWLGRGADLYGLPNAVVLMLALYAAAHVMMSRMRMGRYLYAVGGNREAARLSGVPVDRVLMFAYIASGLLAGVGGVILTSLFKSGAPTYGVTYELSVIAAVVVGGTSLSGGEGKMFGTFLGVLIIAVMQNGMNLMNVDPDAQMVALGAVILAAVVVDQLRHRA
jgi:ribose transport system permease protein